MNIFQPIIGHENFWHWLLFVPTLCVALALYSWVKKQWIRRIDKNSLAPSGDIENNFQKPLIKAIQSMHWGLISIILLYPFVVFWEAEASIIGFFERISSIALIVQIGLFTSALVSNGLEVAQRGNKLPPQIRENSAYALKLLIKLIIWGMVVIMLLENLNISVTPLLAGLGIGSVALGLALQHILNDLFSSFSIMLDKPFEVNHFIEFDGCAGRVQRIGLKSTHIRADSGEMLVVNNHKLTGARIRNYSASDSNRREVALQLNIHPRVALEKVKSIPTLLENALRDPEGKVIFESVHLKELNDFSLAFEVRYSVLRNYGNNESHKHFLSRQHASNMRILYALDENGIELAFARTANWPEQPSTAS